MPTEKTRSFVMQERGSAIVNELTGQISMSGALNLVLERYAEIVRHSTPELTCGEWRTVAAALRQPVGQAWAVGMVDRAIIDAIGLDDAPKQAAEEHSVDTAALADKLTALGLAGKVALVDVVERYHAARARGEAAALPGCDPDEPTEKPKRLQGRPPRGRKK